MSKARTLTLRLPWPPSVNRIWMRSKRGGVYLNPKAKAFKAEVARAVGKVNTIAGRVRLSVWMHAPDAKKIDVDNRLKMTIDSLQTAKVFHNDEQVDEIHAYRCGIAKPGYVTVRIRELN